jgi:hypothetical protein
MMVAVALLPVIVMVPRHGLNLRFLGLNALR